MNTLLPWREARPSRAYLPLLPRPGSPQLALCRFWVQARLSPLEAAEARRALQGQLAGLGLGPVG